STRETLPDGSTRFPDAAPGATNFPAARQLPQAPRCRLLAVVAPTRSPAATPCSSVSPVRWPQVDSQDRPLRTAGGRGSLHSALFPTPAWGVPLSRIDPL